MTLMLRASAAAAHAGEAHRAVSLTRAALAGVGQDTDSELAARVRYTLAGTLMGVDSLTAAFAYSSEALAMIPAEPPSPTWVWAAATHVLAARQVGDTDTALRVARQALGVAERLGLPDARADLLVSLANLEGDGRRSPRGGPGWRRRGSWRGAGATPRWRCGPCSRWRSGPTRPGSPAGACPGWPRAWTGPAGRVCCPRRIRWRCAICNSWCSTPWAGGKSACARRRTIWRWSRRRGLRARPHAVRRPRAR